MTVKVLISEQYYPKPYIESNSFSINFMGLKVMYHVQSITAANRKY